MRKFFTFILGTALSVSAVAEDNPTFTALEGRILNVSVGGMWNYETSSDVAYSYHLYTLDGVEYMDLTVPAYELKGTMVGDLNVGSYVVSGLQLTTADGASFYIRDYADDGLSLQFSSTGSIAPGVYELNRGKSGKNVQRVCVYVDTQKEGTLGIDSIVNTFQVGNMPFALESTWRKDGASSISEARAAQQSSSTIHNVMGLPVDRMERGKIYIVGGRKVMGK